MKVCGFFTFGENGREILLMKTTLIYLAAGGSVRFGEENKLLYPIDGVPMYRCLLDRLEKICGERDGYGLLVVTRYDEIAEHCRARGIAYADSPDSVKGASYSIRRGLCAAAESDAYVFFTADQPYFTAESAAGFFDFMEASSFSLGCAAHNGESGNPVWFGQKYRDELLALEGDRGGKRVMKAHMDECVMYEIEDGRELTDIDERTQDFNENPALTQELTAKLVAL